MATKRTRSTLSSENETSGDRTGPPSERTRTGKYSRTHVKMDDRSGSDWELNTLPLTEVLDHDSRPTFIIDLDPDLDRVSVDGTKQIELLFCNLALRSYEHLKDVICGEADVSEVCGGDTVPYTEFKSWALGVTPHDASRDVWPTTFLFLGMLWTGSTIRRRYRLISGNKCYNSEAVVLADLTQGLPLETAGEHSKPSTTQTNSQGHPHVLDTVSRSSKSAKEATPPSTVVPTATTLTSFEALVSSLKSEARELAEELNVLTDWTVVNPTGPISDYIKFARSVDWASTPLGPLKSWSPELRQIANLAMACPHPIALFMGNDLTMIYNEAYCNAVAGFKHPALMGSGFQGPFSELWDDVSPLFAECRRTGLAVQMEDQMLPMARFNQDFVEETYWSWCLVPLYAGTENIVGFYNAPFDTTDKILAERRTRTLRTLGEETSMARAVKEFWPAVLRGLTENIYDVPFALLYSVSEFASDDGESSISSTGSSMSQKSCILEGCLGVPVGHPAAPEQIDLKRSADGFIPSFRSAMRTRQPTKLQVRDGTLPESLLEEIEWRGWPEACRDAIIFPLRPTNGENVLGFLLVGVNPRLPYKAGYESFVDMLNRQLATGLASTILFEDEIRRGQNAAEVAALEQERLFEELILQKQRFQKMSELATVGLFILDVNGKVVEANDKWYELTGLSKDDVLDLDWMDSITAESREAMKEGWLKLIVENVPWSGELMMKRPWSDVSGTSQNSWLIAAFHPELRADQKLTVVTGSITDVSSLKWAEGISTRRLAEAEETRRQQNNFIDITSHEMRNPLSAILQCADDVASAMRQFLRAPDHEVSPELSSTMADVIESAETIAFCAQHQKSIVDDILTISKLDSDLIVITPAVVQPFAVAQRATKMFEADAQKKGISLTFIAHETFQMQGIDYVTMDANRVMQVLINLLTNAIKFTQSEKHKSISVQISAFREIPTKGIEGFTYVRSKLPLKELEQITESDDWGPGEIVYIGFVVEDSGRGLTPEEKKLLFLRFSQASPKTHARYGGSGLGLFISRQLTEKHGGRIGVASEYGVGSKFGFYVRAKRAAANIGQDLDATLEPSLRLRKSSTGGKDDAGSNEDGASQIAKLPRSASKSSLPSSVLSGMSTNAEPVSASPLFQPQDIWILVVEDNMVNQKVLKKQLDKANYKVSVANHGGEALEYMKTTSRWAENPEGCKLSVILMDLEMPVMNGNEAARNIRRMEADGTLVGHVPIIAVSANVRPEQIQSAKESGMDDMVSKPFRIPDLTSRIVHVLSQTP